MDQEGLDHVFQGAPVLAHGRRQRLDSDGSTIEWPALRVPTSEDRSSAAPGGSVFAGFVCERPIGGIIVDDADGTPNHPDCNIGYDTIRISRAPPVR